VHCYISSYTKFWLEKSINLHRVELRYCLFIGLRLSITNSPNIAGFENVLFLTICFKNNFLKLFGYNFISHYTKQNNPGQCQLTQNSIILSNVTNKTIHLNKLKL